MVGTQVRTIFLAVRGVNMLGESLSKPRTEMSELEKKQADLARSSYRLLFAGAAFLTFGVFMMRALGGLLTQSSKGATMLDDLGLAWGRFSSRLSASVARTLEGQVKTIIGLLEGLSSNQGAVEGLGTLATYGAELVTVLGAIAISAAGLRVLGGVLGGIGGFLVNLSPSITFGLALKGASFLAAITDALGITGLSLVSGALWLALPLVLVFGLSWLFEQQPADLKKKLMSEMQESGRIQSQYYNYATGRMESAMGGSPSSTVNNINIYGNTFGSELSPAEIGTELANEIQNIGMDRP